MIKFLKYLIQSFVVLIFFIVARLIGLKFSRRLFSNIFLRFAPVFKSKKIIDNNILKYKKDISNNEKKEIIYEMWKNYGKTFIEYVFLDKFKKGNSHIILNGEENLSEIIENKKQAIFISGHFANFELMSMEISKKKINLATI